MEVILAIDLLGGNCVRLYQGDYGQSEVFGEDPVTMAKKWQDQGATRLHLVDLDGAKTGEPINLGAIANIVEALNIPVQVGGGLRDRSRVAQLLSLGVKSAILGTAQRMAKFGAAAIIYTDIYRDGKMQGPNLDVLRDLCTHIDIPVIASGGVSSVTDLLSLLELEAIGVSYSSVTRHLRLE